MVFIRPYRKISSFFTHAPHTEAEDSVKPKHYWLFLGVLFFCYFSIYGWLLVSTDFLPYVMDNNESFSSYIHATNLYHFGVSKSFGLTDEAYGLNPAAHPYVYTHGGNFPRFFTFLLYVFGARSVESQIFITTFTIGLIGLFFAYHYFSKVTNALFALIAGLVLITDYILFAQWQVNTWRVWHLFFLFSSLLCAHGLGSGKRPRLWLILTFFNYIGLFYLEFIFAAFVAVFVGLYSAYLYFRSIPTLLKAWSIQVFGAISGVAVLPLQLIAYLGWDTFVQDVQLTYTSRNAASGGSNFGLTVQQFYTEHNIVFWNNFVDGTLFRTSANFIQSLSYYHLQIYTPFLALIVVLVVAAWLLGLLDWNFKLPTVFVKLSQENPIVLTVAATSIFCLSSFLFLAVLLNDQTLMGISPQTAQTLPQLNIALISGVIAITATVIVTNFSIAKWDNQSRYPLRRLLIAALLLWGCAYIIHNHPVLYNQVYQVLWQEIDKRWLPVWINQLVTIVAAGVAISLVIFGGKQILGQKRNGYLPGLVSYLFCGFLAYSFIYFLSPGYLLSGYLRRLVPFFVFHVNILVAIAIYILLKVSSSAFLRTARYFSKKRTSGFSNEKNAGNLIVNLGGAVLTTALFLFIVGYWLNLQTIYLDLLPPNHFSFLKTLQTSPYQGASFVVNTYAAPVASYTGQWAYYDPEISTGTNKLTQEGVIISRDTESFLWLADKTENPAYLEPDYYVCMMYQSLDTVVAGLMNQTETIGEGCSSQGLVKQAQSTSTTQAFFQHQIVAQDETERDAWAIVKLDWDYPPYLRPLSDSSPDTLVGLKIDEVAQGTAVTVQYEYGHLNKAEADPLIRLYSIDEDGMLHLIQETKGVKQLILPQGAAHKIRVSVTPQTATKVGPEYFSHEAVYKAGQWLVDTSARQPLNPNGRIENLEVGFFPSDLKIIGGESGHTVAYMTDEEGSFIRIQATAPTAQLAIASKTSLTTLDGKAASIRGEIRVHSKGELKLTLQDVVAADGETVNYTDEISSDCSYSISSCSRSSAAASEQWITLKIQANQLRYPDPNDIYSIGLYGVEAGDWFDIRELGVYPGWLP